MKLITHRVITRLIVQFLLVFGLMETALSQVWENFTGAIALDEQGNVYITASFAEDTDKDYVTIKYDSYGTPLWTATYDGPGHAHD
ncbi:hypothetical protein HQ531_13015, partial [bacterium]|nr:hypothetical protein [bacterium]